MTASADDAINIYKQLAGYPSVKYGRISMEDTPGHLQVYSEWTQRDLERSETLKFARSHVVQLDVVVPTLPHVICDELWNKESPSGRSDVLHFLYRFHQFNLLSSITPSLFHSRLKTFLFCEFFPP